MDNQTLLDRALPKWPRMKVTGRPVTVEQAKEIIRRTDHFFIWFQGNDREHIAWVCKQLGIPLLPEFPFTNDESVLADFRRESFAVHRQLDAWRERWAYVHTEYVTNEWISTTFVDGPHGWCHPDGSIGFADYVGKWPSVV